MATVLIGHPPTTHQLELTGERTVPDIAHEHYWFTRHLVAYEWIRSNLTRSKWADSCTHRTVLDAGAGEGYGAAVLSEIADLTIALDLDQPTCAHARRRYPGIQPVAGNLWCWPLASHSVDVVISLQVIEHLWDPGSFLAEARRCLRPGGLLVVSTPNRLTFSPGLGRGERPLNPFHVQEFDGEQLVTLLADHGFHTIALAAVLDGTGAELDQQLIGHSSPDQWSATLHQAVARTTPADFPIIDLITLPGNLTNTSTRILDLIVSAHTDDEPAR